MFSSRKKKIVRILNILGDKSLSALQISREARKQHGIFHGLRIGTLAPILLQLEKEGVLRSFWEEGLPPRRRLYAKAEIE